MSSPPAPQLEVSDNPEVGRLYGPDGRLVKIVRARPDRPIGFQPRRHQEPAGARDGAGEG